MDARSAFGRLEPGVKIIAPPEGLARGRYEVPRWAIGALLAVIVVVAVAWIIRRARAPRSLDV
jgi:hypothetical protein